MGFGIEVELSTPSKGNGNGNGNGGRPRSRPVTVSWSPNHIWQVREDGMVTYSEVDGLPIEVGHLNEGHVQELLRKVKPIRDVIVKARESGDVVALTGLGLGKRQAPALLTYRLVLRKVYGLPLPWGDGEYCYETEQGQLWARWLIESQLEGMYEEVPGLRASDVNAKEWHVMSDGIAWARSLSGAYKLRYDIKVGTSAELTGRSLWWEPWEEALPIGEALAVVGDLEECGAHWATIQRAFAWKDAQWRGTLSKL